MKNVLVAMLMAFGAAVLPARAFAAGAPQKLSDVQLDRVTGGGIVLSQVAFLGPPVLRPPMVDPIPVWPDPRGPRFFPEAPPSGIALPLPATQVTQTPAGH